MFKRVSGDSGKPARRRRERRRRIPRASALALAAVVVWALVTASQALALDTTSTTVKCAPESVAVGQASTCTATVTDTSASTNPTGTVTFAPSTEGGFSKTSCEVTPEGPEKAKCSVEYTPSKVGAGTQEVKAAYGGDGTHSSSEGHGTVKVSVRPTSTSVSCIPAGVVVGQVAKCTATVTDEGPVPHSVPTAVVAFESNGTGSFSPSSKECTVHPVAGKEQEVASCSVEYTASAVGSGTHTITASYKGDTTTHGESSKSAPLTVGLRATATTVSCEPSGVVLGQSSRCVVTVTDTAPGTAEAPTGKVKFSSDSEGTFTASPPQCTLSALNGTEAQCSLEYLATAIGSGKHTLTAKYAGDSKHEESGNSTGLSVKRPTVVSISCGAGVSVSQLATCTATVKDAGPGSPTLPTGAVTFASNTTGGAFSPATSCMLAKVTAGESACQVSYTPGQVGSGTHTITAEYEGDATHGSNFASVGLPVSAAAKAAQTGGTTTTTTTPTSTTPQPAPKCRLEASEAWKSTPTGKRHGRKKNVPMILVPYTCDENATVRIAGAITVPANGRGRKRTKAKTFQLAALTRAAVANKSAPAVVLTLPSSAAKALTSGVRERASVTFTVKNANGTGVATLTLTLLPRKG